MVTASDVEVIFSPNIQTCVALILYDNSQKKACVMHIHNNVEKNIEIALNEGLKSMTKDPQVYLIGGSEIKCIPEVAMIDDAIKLVLERKGLKVTKQYKLNNNCCSVANPYIELKTGRVQPELNNLCCSAIFSSVQKRIMTNASGFAHMVLEERLSSNIYQQRSGTVSIVGQITPATDEQIKNQQIVDMNNKEVLWNIFISASNNGRIIDPVTNEPIKVPKKEYYTRLWPLFNAALQPHIKQE